MNYARAQGIDTLVLTSRFAMYYQGPRFNNGEGGIESGRPTYVDLIEFIDEKQPFESQARKDRVLDAYSAKITELLEEFKVVLVYPIPEAGWNVPVKASKLLRDNLPVTLSYGRAGYEARNKTVTDAFDQIQHPNLYRVRPEELLCDAERCHLIRDGKPLYYDDDHLADSTGAALLAPMILQQVRRSQ